MKTTLASFRKSFNTSQKKKEAVDKLLARTTSCRKNNYKTCLLDNQLTFPHTTTWEEVSHKLCKNWKHKSNLKWYKSNSTTEQNLFLLSASCSLLLPWHIIFCLESDPLSFCTVHRNVKQQLANRKRLKSNAIDITTQTKLGFSTVCLRMG